MPPSQLKRLKESLKEQGIVGPQKSKKQKKQNAQSGADRESRLKRNVALNSIREQFNPFDIKTSARGPKFDVTSNRNLSGRVSKGIKGRPGVTKGLGEENRRKTLLVEIRRRNKVGGFLDRRFGENDPTMAPEDKMLERFTQEKQLRHKNSSAFDLEEEDSQHGLTHMGKSLSLDGPALVDDFDEEGLQLSDAEDHLSDDDNPRKRRREFESDGSKDDHHMVEGTQERKKSKQEVMKEVVAKSKLYKYERQAVKDDDDDLREELDKDMAEIHTLLRTSVPRPPASKPLELNGMNPDRAALLGVTDKIEFGKTYDMRLRQLAQDKKSNPTERSKTEEEKLGDESRRLRELEAQRLRRMKGEANEEEDQNDKPQDTDFEDRDNEEENEDFGFGSGIQIRDPMADLGVEEEDDFIVDDGLVASGSDVDISDDDTSETRQDKIEDDDDDDDDGFLDGLLTEEEAKRPEFLTGANAFLKDVEAPAKTGINGDLAYTFPCPESHEQILEVTRNIEPQDLPIVVWRIRALYHPKLSGENRLKMGNFTAALVDHISYLANQTSPQFKVIENLIRHIHSLAKTYPVETANTFRKHLKAIDKIRPLSPTIGDLIILTAIGSIFPTSDHFHQVVTPAMLTMGRYIGQKIPNKRCDYVMGTYLISLSLHYQKLSKRYVPEVVGFLLNTLCASAPSKPSKVAARSFPYHEGGVDRPVNAADIPVRRLRLSDVLDEYLNSRSDISLAISLLKTSVDLLDIASDTWTGKPAFFEVFAPVLKVLEHFESKACRSKLPETLNTIIMKFSQKLERLLKHAQTARQPLELHHHRPLAIKTSIPKFEEAFNPDKHYDPDRERAEASKLRAELKRERKGAMRELRKDGNFIARESLREKKEKDAAYEKKYKRLVAEIQGEEGRESQAYEREKEWRKKGRK